MSASSVLFLGTGRMSTFGGPSDLGVNCDEGLALIEPADLHLLSLGPLFLPQQPPGTSGLARRLNPLAFYVAMRWDEVLKPYGRFYFTPQHTRNLITTVLLRKSFVRLLNPRTGACEFARPVDYGPGDGKIVDGVTDPDTGRIADLSPGCAKTLGLETDQYVRCELILPEMETA